MEAAVFSRFCQLVGTKLLLAVATLCLAATVQANDVAIVIGVSDYQAFAGTERGDLHWADEDARLFAATAVERMGFDRKDVIVLVSHPKEKSAERPSSADEILKAMTELARRQKDASTSRFFFFFSGHGVTNAQGEAILAAQDYDPEQPLKGGQANLTAAAVQARLSKLRVRFALAAFDICRYRGYLAASRQLNKKLALTRQDAKSVATLFSSTDGPSYEGPEALGHGYFTHYLCKGMTPEPDGPLPVVPAMNEDGRVTLASLGRYVVGQVAQESALGRTAGTRVSGQDASSGLGQIPAIDAGGAQNETLAIFPLTGFRTFQSTLQRYHALRNEGLEHYQRGEFQRAGDYLSDAFETRALGTPKEQAWAAYAAGMAYRASGDRTKAEAQYRLEIATYPENADAMNNLGFLLQEYGDLASAKTWYEAAAKVDPKHPYALTNLGILLKKEGDVAGAEKKYRAALDSNPNDAGALYNLGVLVDERGEADLAESLFRKVIVSDPTYAKAMTNLAVILMGRNDLKEAEKHLRAALVIDPKDALSMYDLGVIRFTLKDFEDAEKWFRRAMETDSNDPSYPADLAYALFKQGKKEEAAAYARKAKQMGLKEHPVFKELTLDGP